MKKYLEELCDELDYIFTNCECDNNWREQILQSIHKHLFENKDMSSKKISNDIKQAILKGVNNGIA